MTNLSHYNLAKSTVWKIQKIIRRLVIDINSFDHGRPHTVVSGAVTLVEFENDDVMHGFHAKLHFSSLNPRTYKQNHGLVALAPQRPWCCGTAVLRLLT